MPDLLDTIPPCCGDCARWSLEGSPLRAHGFGTCSARPDHLRAAFTTSELNVCRLGKFQPKEGA